VPLGLLLVPQDGSQGPSGPSSPGVDPVSSPPPTTTSTSLPLSLVISFIIQCYRLLSLHGSWRSILLVIASVEGVRSSVAIDPSRRGNIENVRKVVSNVTTVVVHLLLG
jgi:hypothetical protein